MRALMAGVEATADPAEQAEILRAAQERVAAHYVNAFLFQLAKTGVADAQDPGALGELADPGERHDRGLLGGVSEHGRGRHRACAGGITGVCCATR